jgi:ferritin
MRIQATEEVNHAMRLFDYVNDRNGRVILKALEQPPANFKSVLDVFEHALKHEMKVTGLIHSLYELAKQENDYATQVALQWFINEQVEEEATASKVVDRLKIAGDDGGALLMLDNELGARKDEDDDD